MTYSVQRHPKCLFTVKAAPMVGPIVGPPTTATAKNATAVPRDFADQMSPSAAPTLLTGADPNTPAKNLVIKIL